MKLKIYDKLPKFESTGWLIGGMAAGVLLFATGLWSAIAQWQSPFLPFQLAKILSIIIGVGLTVHCGDMILYHRHNRGTAAKQAPSPH